MNLSPGYTQDASQARPLHVIERGGWKAGAMRSPPPSAHGWKR